MILSIANPDCIHWRAFDLQTGEEIQKVFYTNDKDGKEEGIIKRYATDKNGNVLTNKEKTKLIIIEEKRWVKLKRIN